MSEENPTIKCECGETLKTNCKICPNCGREIFSSLSCPKCRTPFSSSTALTQGADLTRTKASDNKITSPFFTEGQINNEILLTEGEELLGRFVIRTRLGGGQFGSVYHALDRERREDVALKVVITGPGRAQAATEQLRQELRLRGRINDFTHIVRTYDIHTVAYEGLSLVLLPMEYAEAGSLRSWLNDNKHKKEQRISKGLELFKQACFGVKAMHDAGLVHLDLKPENLLLCKDGDMVIVKVSDFGISRNIEHLSMNIPSVTQDGLGTPYYMSPEQISAPRQKDVGPQADVYSLGVILFEILDGDPPFDGSAGQVKQKHLEIAPPRLKVTDEYLSSLVYQCLAKTPAERLENASAVLTALGIIDDDQHEKHISFKKNTPEINNAITNSVGMELVWIPPGEFDMGSPSSEEPRSMDSRETPRRNIFDRRPPWERVVYIDIERPVHHVKISSGFYMGKFELTQEQYLEVMEENPSCYSGFSLPVECVCWDDAVNFCNRLSQMEGKIYRLPTEAEWEYACRAGTRTCFYYGDDYSGSQLARYAWYEDSSGGRPHPVGKKIPNAFGLYDMHGNLWEWCSDWYDAEYYSSSITVDPQGPESYSIHGIRKEKVLRGGSYMREPEACRSAYRDHETHEAVPLMYKFGSCGFRVVLDSR